MDELWRYTESTLGLGLSLCHYCFLIKFVELDKYLPRINSGIEYIVRVGFPIMIGVDWILLFGFDNLLWSAKFEVIVHPISKLIPLIILLTLFKINSREARILRVSYIFIIITFSIFYYYLVNKLALPDSIEPFYNTATLWVFELTIFVENIVLIWLFIDKAARVLEEKNAIDLKLQLKTMEEQRLQQHNSLITDLYTNITHEFRTPLTVIQGMAEELVKVPKKDRLQKLGLIKKNSQSLLTLVNQLLDLSKLEAGKSALQNQQGNIIAFLKYAIEAHGSYAKSQEIDLQFYSEEKQLAMDFDERKLEQVLSNLVTNAIKFTPAYGKILVIAKKIGTSSSPTLQIKIVDNGVGIASEELPYIFDRFHRLDDSHQTIGTGIGLAVVKELVKLMEGTIKVKSKITEGTTFILTFPIRQQAPIAEFIPSSTFQKRIITPTPTVTNDHPYLLELPLILLVEDNEDVAYYIHTCLKKQYQVLTAVNGRLGLEMAIEKIPDLIISDVMMPEMDGFELCQQIKTDERTNHIPFILLTAKAAAQDRVEGLQKGADAYLLKPFEREELLVRVQKLLEMRRLLHLKYSQNLAQATKSEIPKTIIENAFLQKTEAIILAYLDEEDFAGTTLAKAMLLSRSQLYRKIKALTGMSTAVYIRHVRLLQARLLLQEGKLSITEVAYRVGFKSPAYFSQTFKRTFGASPSEVRMGARLT